MFYILGLLLLLATTAQAQPVMLLWTDNSTNELGFKGEKTISGNCTDGWFEVFTVGVNVTSWVDEFGQELDCYRLNAFNSSGVSAYSNTAQVPLAPPPPVLDTEPPQVFINSPANNSTVARRSTAVIAVSATDNVQLASIQYLVNGSPLSCGVLAFSCSWKVPNSKNKLFTIVVRATDTSNNVGQAQVTVRSGR